MPIKAAEVAEYQRRVNSADKAAKGENIKFLCRQLWGRSAATPDDHAGQTACSFIF